MRLTLRTLLAHLDQILDEPDRDELEQKIEESDFATQLVHRIRSVLAQQQLTALDVCATGIGRDANSVSEYLDNTLPAEKISDFERVCLESDVHLSEVAACHQILTLVLGEPAEVPEGLKEKIYRLPHARSSAPTTDASAPTISRAPVSDMATEPTQLGAEPTEQPSSGLDTELGKPLDSDSGVPSKVVDAVALPSSENTADSSATWDEDEHWTEAPDYLKRPRPGRWKSAAVATLIAFCLAMAGLRGMGPLNRSHPLAKRMGLFDSNQIAAIDAQSQELGDAEPVPNGRDTGDSTPFVPSDERERVMVPEQTATEGFGGDAIELDAPQTRPPAVANVLDEFPEKNSDSTDGPPRDEPIDVRPPTVVPDREVRPTTEEEDPFGASFPPADPLPPSQSASNTLIPSAAPPVDPAASEERVPGDLNFATANNDLSAAGTNAGQVETGRLEAGPGLVNPLATNVPRPPTPAIPIPPAPMPRRDVDAAADADGDLDEGDATPAAPPRRLDIGRFLDPQQILVKLDAESDLWQRVVVGTRLQVGDLLMSLPTFRSPLILASGMQVVLIGGTRVQALEPDVESTPFFQLDFGQLTVATFAQTGTTFGLRWSADHGGMLTLADMNTALAIQLRPQYTVGANPDESAPHRVLHVYVTSGSVEWNSNQGPSIQIAAGQRLTLVDDYPAVLVDADELPKWIDGRDARPRDPIAARGLAQRLVADRPVSLVLREQADSGRAEVRSLAVCSLAYLGDFDPLFVALNDAKLRSYWAAQYDVLSTAPSFSPEFTASVKNAIADRHGADEGMKLFRMLWGHSPDQLQNGDAAELVSYLDHPSYDFRIVASEQLKSITGQPSLFRANAGDRNPQRRAAVSRWRKMLNKGEIVYKQLPELDRLLIEDGKPVVPQPRPAASVD